VKHKQKNSQLQILRHKNNKVAINKL
jgi:hypothetical protein